MCLTFLAKLWRHQNQHAKPLRHGGHRAWRGLAVDDRGTAYTEYAIGIAIVAAGLIWAASAIETSVSDKNSELASTMNSFANPGVSVANSGGGNSGGGNSGGGSSGGGSSGGGSSGGGNGNGNGNGNGGGNGKK